MTKCKKIHEKIQNQGRSLEKKIMNEAKDCYNILALFHSHVNQKKWTTCISRLYSSAYKQAMT